MVETTRAGRPSIVIWMVLLVALLAAIDVVTAYVRDHQVRYLPLAVCVGLVICAGVMARRGRP